MKEKCMIGGQANMCQALKEMMEEEREKGVILGVIRTAHKYGATLGEIIADLVENCNLDESEARSLCEQTIARVK